MFKISQLKSQIHPHTDEPMTNIRLGFRVMQLVTRRVNNTRRRDVWSLTLKATEPSTNEQAGFSPNGVALN